MKKAVIQLETLACPSCMQKIETGIKKLKGVDQESVKVLFNASKVKFDFDTEHLTIDQIQSTVEQLGYEVLKTTVK